MQQWIRCPRCGANNAPGQRFCNACGTPLASGCTNCGTPLNPGATFCPRCGMPAGQQQGGYPQQPQGYPPQQPGYPPQQPGYPPQQPGYPPQQPGYPPQQQGYPPQPGYPPNVYPQQQPGYPPQQPGYPPQQPGYPLPQPGYPPQTGYPPPQPGYPPSPSRGYPGAAAPRQGGGKGMLVFLLIILIVGLGGFGYWAYSQGYLKGIPFLNSGSSDNSTSSTGPKYTAPPTISGVQISAKAITEVFILWSTDQPSSSQVEWGPTATYGTLTPITDEPGATSSGVVAHPVKLTGLTAGTTYHYRVISKNKDGLSATSEDNTFTTPTE